VPPAIDERDCVPTSPRDRVNPYRLYIGLELVNSLLVAFIYTTSIVYWVTDGHLNPLQLVLLGTVIELTYFVCQLPTGILADLYSRRFCIVASWLLCGAGFAMQGMSASFLNLALAQVVVGLGAALQDGAQSAWIADETDEEHMTPVYLRATQAGIVGAIIGSVGSGLVSGIGLNLPMLTGGIVMCAAGIGLAFVMPEKRRPERTSTATGTLRRQAWADFTDQITTTRIAVVAVPGFVLLLGMTFFLGMWSESFDRLWSAYLLEDITFPHLYGLRPALWLSTIAVMVQLLALGTSEVAKRRLARLGPASAVTTLLGAIGLIALGVIAMASARVFVFAVLAYLLVQALRPVVYPLLTGWIVGRVPSGVRATALSARDMFDSGGQMIGGPFIGWVGLSRSIRTALYVGAAAFGPALLLLVAATRRVRVLPPAAAEPDVVLAAYLPGDADGDVEGETGDAFSAVL
jgi:MFS transporter, DHA3 family, tetracycline resistance protein